MEDISNSEILEALNAFAEATDRRFEGLETTMNRRFTKIESQMVTKDYLDRKLWNLKSDVHGMINQAIGKHETKFHAA